MTDAARRELRFGRLRIDVRFVRFLIVGGLNTLFGYGVFALFLALHVHYSLAALMSTTMGILFNFKTYGILVFKSSDNRLLSRFLGVYGLMYIVGVTGIAVLKSFAMSAFAAGAILAVPMALVSFLLNRRYVFERNQRPLSSQVRIAPNDGDEGSLP